MQTSAVRANKICIKKIDILCTYVYEIYKQIDFAHEFHVAQ